MEFIKGQEYIWIKQHHGLQNADVVEYQGTKTDIEINASMNYTFYKEVGKIFFVFYSISNERIIHLDSKKRVYTFDKFLDKCQRYDKEAIRKFEENFPDHIDKFKFNLL